MSRQVTIPDIKWERWVAILAVLGFIASQAGDISDWFRLQNGDVVLMQKTIHPQVKELTAVQHELQKGQNQLNQRNISSDIQMLNKCNEPDAMPTDKFTQSYCEDLRDKEVVRKAIEQLEEMEKSR